MIHYVHLLLSIGYDGLTDPESLRFFCLKSPSIVEAMVSYRLIVF